MREKHSRRITLAKKIASMTISDRTGNIPVVGHTTSQPRFRCSACGGMSLQHISDISH